MLSSTPLQRRLGPVKWSLRALGLLDLAALFAVFMPDAWIAESHRLAGLGSFPADTIAGYLARSASAMYALHGALLIFVSCDVPRYWRLIQFLAFASIVHGAITVGIDVREDMPLWWTLAEGPSFALTGLVILLAQWRAR